MHLKNRQLKLWYILPTSKELKKIEIDLLPIGVFLTAFLLSIIFFFTWGFLTSENAISQTKKHFAYILGNLKLKNLKAESSVLKEKNLFLEEELNKATNINEEIIQYGNNIERRNQELAKLIEDTTQLKIFEDKVIIKNGGIGGLEFNNDLDGKELKGSFNLNKFDFVKQKKLIKNMDEINSVIGILPIGLPVNSYISSDFGIRQSPFTGRLAKHLGIDFSAPYGYPIKVTGKGEIIRADYSKTYGYIVDVKHKDNLFSRYAHLSKILVKKGDIVSRGNIIGLVGSSGRSTGSHLHYELRVNNTPINPISFINLASNLSNKLKQTKTVHKF